MTDTDNTTIPAANKSVASESKASKPKPPTKRAWSGWLVVLILVLLMGGGGWAGYAYLWPQWQQRNEQQQRQLHELRAQLVDQQHQLNEFKDILAAQSERLRQQLQGDVAGLARQQYEQHKRQQETLEAYQRGVESVQAELANLDLSQQTHWRLLEARNLVARAGQSLWIDGNVRAAQQLLQLADSHLAALNNPAFSAARQALASDLFALQALPDNQIADAARRLAAVHSQLSAVNWYQRQPGRSAVTSVDSDADWLTQLQQTGGKLMNQLIRVQYRETPVQPLLSDTFVELLQQRTLLQLQLAQQAALANQQALYLASLQQALVLIQRLGSTDVQAIVQAQSELDALAQLQLSPELPSELQATAQIERLVRQLTQERGL